MTISPADAIAAYKANITSAPSAITPSEGASSPNSNFMEMVKGLTQDTIDTNKHAEEISKQALTGRAELADVVTAVAHAETTLQTVVTVRDKVISTYQEILRMPI